MKGAAVPLAECLQLTTHVGGHFVHVHRRLLGHAAHLEAASEVDCGHVRELRDEVERHSHCALPHLGVSAVDERDGWTTPCLSTSLLDFVRARRTIGWLREVVDNLVHYSRPVAQDSWPLANFRPNFRLTKFVSLCRSV